MTSGARNREGPLLALQQALDLESLWAATLRLLDAELRYHSCSLHLGIENYRAAESRHRVVAGDYFNYASAGWVRVSGPFLETHPKIKLYTYQEVLREDPKARMRRLEKEVVLSAWNEFVHLAFWNGRTPAALLSVRRTSEQGEFTLRERELLRRLHPMIEAGLQRIRALHRERRRSAAIEGYLGRLPIPVMLVSLEGRVAFATREAFDCCARWNHGENAARLFNSRANFRLPAELLAAFAARAGDRQRNCGGQGASLQVGHPTQPGFCAWMEPAEPSGVPTDESFFIVTFGSGPQLPGAAPEGAREGMDALRTLTPSERQVALRVADGFRNQDIAAALGKSLRTVEFQLNAIYRKLGITSRTHLTRLILSQSWQGPPA